MFAPRRFRNASGTGVVFENYKLLLSEIDELIADENLDSLSLSRCTFEKPLEEWLGLLTSITNLSLFALGSNPSGKQGIFFDDQFNRVNTRLNDEIMRCLTAMPKLASLSICNCGITDEQFSLYDPRRCLNSLTLMDNSLSGKSLINLRSTEQLVLLNLRGNNLVDASLDMLPDFPLLKNFDISSNPRITSKSVVTVNRFRNMKCLECFYTGIDTDFFVGLDKSIPIETLYTNIIFDSVVISQLQKISSLEKLFGEGEYSESELSAIQAALPNVYIEFFPIE